MLTKQSDKNCGGESPAHAYFRTSSGVGPAGSSDAARLHWWNARTWSFLNVPTTEWRRPRLWKSTKSFSRLSPRQRTAQSTIRAHRNDLPVVGIYQLPYPEGTDQLMSDVKPEQTGKRTHRGRDCGALHLVQQVPDLLQVRQMRAVGKERTLAVCACWEWVNEKLLHATGVHLEVQLARDRVLPCLSCVCE